MIDRRHFAPATSRNREPILDILRQLLPPRGTVLEIASGTGEHIVHMAMALPHLDFQPTDIEEDALESIAAWIEATGAGNTLPPLYLDAASADWPVTSADAIFCINMIHIAPWRAAVGLFAGARRILPAGAPLYLYGPYRRAGFPTAPSNEAFDQNLRSRDPSWGLRDLEAVADLARLTGFGPPEIIEMAANNLSVIFRKL